METNEILEQIRRDIADLKKAGISPAPLSNQVSNKWASEKQVKAFLSYESTQMASFLKTEGIVVSKIGKRKFVLKESIEALLERNILAGGSNTKSNHY